MVMMNKVSHSKKNHHRYCLFDVCWIMKRKGAPVTDRSMVLDREISVVKLESFQPTVFQSLLACGDVIGCHAGNQVVVRCQTRGEKSTVRTHNETVCSVHCSADEIMLQPNAPFAKKDFRTFRK